MEENEYRTSRTSLGRRFLSYLTLGLATVAPLAIYYLADYYGWLTYEAIVVQFAIGDAITTISFAEYMIPLVTSIVVGVSGSYILWCYYTRTKCLEEQVPNSVLLCPD